MKYTTEEAMAEIMRRSDEITDRRNRRAKRALSGTAGTLLGLIILVISILPGGEKASVRSLYGSFLLSPEAGGYVLVGVLAFALGIVITLLCLKLRRQKTEENEKEDER